MLESALRWSEQGGRLTPSLVDHPDVEVAWAPQGRGQETFLSCPVTEAVFAGNRGGGKSLAMLMDFAQHVDQGYGIAWRGIVMGREFNRLRNFIDLSLEWVPRIFPAAVYNRSEHHWTWPGGEKLFFAQMERLEDYHKYHGWGLSWIGWEELTNWPASDCYLRMFSVLRSTRMDMPRKVRSTTNPGGPGHNWVKHRFGLPIAPGKVIGPIAKDPKSGMSRVAIRSDMAENRALMVAEPDYVSVLMESAGDDKHVYKAWIEGSWDIIAGGMIDDLWNPEVHVVPPIPLSAVPKTWRLDRSYDDGQTSPFAVCWWAQSSGEPITWQGRRLGDVKGDLFYLGEWYGWNGTPNKGLKLTPREIALGILERESKWGVTGRVWAGFADSAIFNTDRRDPNATVEGDMRKAGVSWLVGAKHPGSRKQGWTKLRQMLKDAIAINMRRENPGLFVSSACEQFLRTMPVLQRDKKDPDDVDTETEDHIADAVRYRILRPRSIEKPVAHLVY